MSRRPLAVIGRTSAITAMALALAGVQLQSPAAAQQAQAEAWQVALKLQLASEVKCQLKEVLTVTKVPVAGLDGYKGRIRCEDQREFDFSQSAPNQKFIIKLCRPTVC
ncbi:MAG: hypothetical protein R3D67_20695 [Hyphomicrobiaceae bacterium]